MIFDTHIDVIVFLGGYFVMSIRSKKVHRDGEDTSLLGEKSRPDWTLADLEEIIK